MDEIKRELVQVQSQLTSALNENSILKANVQDLTQSKEALETKHKQSESDINMMKLRIEKFREEQQDKINAEVSGFVNNPLR